MRPTPSTTATVDLEQLQQQQRQQQWQHDQQQRQQKAVMVSPHVLAQKLNNCAAASMQSQQYEEGIQLLTRALQITEQDTTVHRSSNEGCDCPSCSLEACLLMSHDSQEKAVAAAVHDQGRTDVDPTFLTPQPDPQAGTVSSSSSSSSSSKNEEGGFVFQRPVLVHTQCIEEHHYMGMTLSLIILFNLALAHHLKAIDLLRTKTTTTTTHPQGGEHHPPHDHHGMQVLHKALQLYELAYKLHVEYIQQQQQQQQQEQHENDDHPAPQATATNTTHNAAMAPRRRRSSPCSSSSTSSSIGSLRLTMIVSNNLGEIHRLAGNTHKHTLCLEHLVSAIMYTVDCNLLQHVVRNSDELDGYYSNVSPVIFAGDCDICAEAA